MRNDYKRNTLISLLAHKNAPIAIILTLTICCNFNILFNDYSLDDLVITGNPYVTKGVSGLKDIWTHASLIVSKDIQIDYRPMALTMFSIESIVFGKYPLVGHVFSLLFYLLCLILLYKVCIDVFKIDKIHPYFPLLVVLLYSVHPSHAEVVASIKNTDELISFVFILLTALCYNRSYEVATRVKTISWMLLTFFLLYCSMLSKLTSLPFMASLFLWSLYAKHYKKYTIFGIFLGGVFFMVALHMWSFREFFLARHSSYTVFENPVMPGTSLALKMGLGFNSLLFYLKFLIYPFPFRFYYGYNVIHFETIANPMPLLSLLLYTLLTALLIYSIIKKKAYSYYLFAFLFYALFYSNLLTPYLGIVSERAMFHFTFFFIAFLLIFILDLRTIQPVINKKPSKGNAPYLCVYLFFLSVFFILTIKRNADWKDIHTLLVHDMKYLDNSTLANSITAYHCTDKSKALRTSGDTVSARKWGELAVFYYSEMLRLSPEWPNTYFLRGKVYRYCLGDFDQAQKDYLACEERAPELEGLSREIASIYFVKQEYTKAIPYYEHAVKEEPEDAELFFYQVLNLYNTRNIQQFLTLNGELLKKFPVTQYPYLNYASYYFGLNDIEKAIPNFEKAIRYGCDNPQVLDYVIRYYTQKNDFAMADHYQKLRKEN